jgi:phosphatidylglycerol lysyltransferase
LSNDLAKPDGGPLAGGFLARFRSWRLQALALPGILIVFLAALWILHRELGSFSFDDILQEFRDLPLSNSLMAVGVTVLSYLVLSLYDLMALHHIGQRLKYRRVALASFIAYVFSHNIGLAVLTGGSVRFRVYGTVGLSGSDIATITLLCVTTYVLGATLLGGTALLLEPGAIFSEIHLPIPVARGAGVFCLACVLGYMIWTATRRKAIVYRGLSLSTPPISLTLKQILLSVVDITLASLALYLLLPSTVDISFLAFLGIFVLATLAGMISHIPGGVGVFESAIVLLVPGAPADALLASALAYRVIYYLLPLAVAAVLLGGFEVFQQKEKLARVKGLLDPVADRLAPQLMGITVLLAGTVLLLSGASPVLDQRLAVIREVLPLPVLEVSHLLASLAGLGLLILSRGLFHRLDGAYWLTISLLAAAFVLSLLKGFDVVTAITLLVVLLALLLCRRAFYRKASLLDQAFSLGWITTITVIIAGTLWLGFFSYKHVDYADRLWWQFAFSDDAPRFLRASLLVIAGAVVFAVMKLLRPAPAAPGQPDAEALARAKEVVARAGTAESNLVLLGDKSLLFSDSGRSFIMYGISGRSWIALGEPVGPAEEQSELVWAFPRPLRPPRRPGGLLPGWRRRAAAVPGSGLQSGQAGRRSPGAA